MMPTLLAVALVQTGQFRATAKLGQEYMLGVETVVSGTKEVIDTGSLRLVTVNAAWTAQAFATKSETHVAPEGKKLLLLNCTIKNPRKSIIHVSSSETVGIRVWERELGVMYSYLRAAHEDRSNLATQLKQGETVKVVLILTAPEQTPHAHIGLAYGQYASRNIRWYDIQPVAKKSTSIFSTDGFNFRGDASHRPDAPFEFETVELTVGSPREIKDGLAVDVVVKNLMLMPTKWGWQYAAATLIGNDGKPFTFYPSLYLKGSDEAWMGELAVGESRELEYRFYPKEGMAPSKFVLEMSATKRKVTINY